MIDSVKGFFNHSLDIAKVFTDNTNIQFIPTIWSTTANFNYKGEKILSTQFHKLDNVHFFSYFQHLVWKIKQGPIKFIKKCSKKVQD